MNEKHQVVSHTETQRSSRHPGEAESKVPTGFRVKQTSQNAFYLDDKWLEKHDVAVGWDSFSKPEERFFVSCRGRRYPGSRISRARDRAW